MDETPARPPHEEEAEVADPGAGASEEELSARAQMLWDIVGDEMLRSTASRVESAFEVFEWVTQVRAEVFDGGDAEGLVFTVEVDEVEGVTVDDWPELQRQAAGAVAIGLGRMVISFAEMLSVSGDFSDREIMEQVLMIEQLIPQFLVLVEPLDGAVLCDPSLPASVLHSGTDAGTDVDELLDSACTFRP